MSEWVQQLRLVEALLFAAAEPLTEEVLNHRLPDAADLPALLSKLAEDYADRGVNLVRLAGALGVPHRARSCRRVAGRAAGQPQIIACGGRDPGGNRLPPTGHTRAEIEEIRVGRPRQGHCRYPDGSGLGLSQGPPREPRQAAAVGHHTGLPRAFRPRQSARFTSDRRVARRRPPRPDRAGSWRRNRRSAGTPSRGMIRRPGCASPRLIRPEEVEP